AQEWDLPGCCADTAETIDERHNVLANKLRGIENQSRQTFIDRAAHLGHTITVTEYAPGDVIPGHSYIPPADACFFIQINAAVGKVIPRHIGDEFGGAFNSWNKQQLECALQEIVLSHMTLIFSYS
ncbi:MAG: DUF2313 domain-containing protein, partial [Pseudomonadales bacterium]|nr:DUF2313 domain-containing protein [Pseudomonadales bacterium]